MGMDVVNKAYYGTISACSTGLSVGLHAVAGTAYYGKKATLIAGGVGLAILSYDSYNHLNKDYSKLNKLNPCGTNMPIAINYMNILNSELPCRSEEEILSPFKRINDIFNAQVLALFGLPVATALVYLAFDQIEHGANYLDKKICNNQMKLNFQQLRGQIFQEVRDSLNNAITDLNRRGRTAIDQFKLEGQQKIQAIAAAIAPPPPAQQGQQQ